MRVARIQEADELAGLRVLADRLWPRGISRDRARIDVWAKDLAPSAGLRKWFHENRDERHEEFVKRYRRELDDADHADVLDQLRGHDDLLLLTASKDVEGSHVPVMADWLRAHL